MELGEVGCVLCLKCLHAWRKYETSGNMTPSRSSNEADNRSIWDLIWNVKVPEKVRIFAWRLATEKLPRKENKRKITLVVDNICNICGSKKGR